MYGKIKTKLPSIRRRVSIVKYYCIVTIIPYENEIHSRYKIAYIQLRLEALNINGIKYETKFCCWHEKS